MFSVISVLRSQLIRGLRCFLALARALFSRPSLRKSRPSFAK